VESSGFGEFSPGKLKQAIEQASTWIHEMRRRSLEEDACCWWWWVA
jgi:hypothetical protein